MFSFGNDISARKKAEDALIESEEKLQQLFDNMINGLSYHQIVLNDSGEPIDYIFLDLNPAFEELTGLEKKVVVGKKVTEVIPRYWRMTRQTG